MNSSATFRSRNKKRRPDPRSFILATYALCGFANFSSIAIQIGGIGALAPDRRSDLARLGLRAMIAGLLACYLTATVVGVLIWICDGSSERRDCHSAISELPCFHAHGYG